ncbi:MAG: hypothetical protein U0744_07660 [Gemmataceae bacterium]
MAPRWKSSLYVFLWFATSLLLLGGSAWIGAWGASCFRGGGPERQDNVIAGLICGLALWLFVAVFHIGRESIVVPIVRQKDFSNGMREILTDMGYHIVAYQDHFLDAKPGFLAMLMGGGIEVEVSGSNAHIRGPKLTLEALQTRLRYRNHLATVQRRTTPIAVRLEPERFVRHVEISATIDATTWDDFRAKVLQPLATEGCVRLDVHLLIAPEDGVRDSVVEDPPETGWNAHAEDTEVRKDFCSTLRPHVAETQPLP